MSRSLYWTLILGCLGLVALYARPAWDALSTSVPATALAATAIPDGVERGVIAVVGSAPVQELETQGVSSLVVAENL